MIMRVLWLFLLLVLKLENGLLLASGVGTNHSTRPRTVTIGAIFSFNSTIGKVAKVAIQAAVDDVNSSSQVLNGTNLSITMQDCQSGFLGIIQTMTFMESDVVAIIGPQSSDIAHVVSQVATGLQVPLLTFAGTDPTLSSVEYPFVVPTTQNDLFQMAAIADIVSHYGWREVTAIYTDDSYGRNGIVSLGDELAKRQCRISYKAPLSPDPSIDDIRSVLFKVISEESRILVIHTYDKFGLEILEVARSLQMLDSSFVWIATRWLTDVIDTDSPLSTDALSDVQGFITLRPHTPNSQPKKNFMARWSNLVRKENMNNALFGLNTFGLYAYDTVWILAYALDAYFSQGGNISFTKYSTLDHAKGSSNLHLDSISSFDGGESLLSKIYQTNMTGLTGLIRFDKDRYLINPAFDIINVVGTGLYTIGYWSNHSGLSVKPPEDVRSKPPVSSERLLSVIWPGKTTEKPRGWVYPNNGKVLRIGVPRRVNYLEFVSYSARTDSFTGYSIDVFTSALNLLPYGIAYKLIPFGDGKSNPKIDDLIEELARGVFDAVVGDIVITTKRTRMVDFTQPFVESGLVVVAPVKTKESDAWAFLWPLTPMLWCVTGLSVIVLGAVIWILEHRFNDEFRGSPQNQIKTVIWFSCSTWFGSQRETTLSVLGRIVLFIWIYTASLSSIQTVQNLYSPVKGIETLMESKYPIGYQNGSFSESYLHEELHFPMSRLVALENENEYVEALRKGPKNGGVAAIVDDMTRIETFLAKRCEFTVRGQKFTKNGRGFAFPRGSPLAVDMSTAILKMTENGDLQRIHDKWLRKSACRSQDTKLTVNRLELKSFSGLFLLSGVACIFALILYFGVMVRKFMRFRPPKEEESVSPTAQITQPTCLKTFFTFANAKDDETQSC
ncbi:hypothetical protein SOVF_056890 [Spinacia oleracea]|nr:hypothetical protein SOVF_056890 [Spinacia oleracea]